MRHSFLTAAPVLALLGFAALPSAADAQIADRAIRVQMSANSSAQFFAQREARSPAVMLGRGATAVAQPGARPAIQPMVQPAAQPMGRAVAQPVAQPVAMGMPAAAAARPAVMTPAQPPQSHGVIFAARTPSSSFGMVVASSDRMAAFRNAEQRCTAGGPGCRVIAEFTAACGAVAQGIRRHQWALIMTNDASTWTITSTNAGYGATQEAAEAEALAECRSRDRNTCRIAAAQCGSRN